MAEKQLSNEELLTHLQMEVIRLSRLAEHWKKVALTDFMTGLPNRMAFLEKLTEALDHTQASRRNDDMLLGHKVDREHRDEKLISHVAIAFIDLDGFKAINDKYGHDAGDEVLRAVGKYLKETLRTSDTITLYQDPNAPEELAGRLGGDEFVMILPHTDSEKIQQRKEEIEAGLNKIAIDYKGTKIEVHGSMAVIDCDLDLSPEENLAIVDNLMYERKEERKAKQRTHGQQMPMGVVTTINGMSVKDMNTYPSSSPFNHLNIC